MDREKSIYEEARDGTPLEEKDRYLKRENVDGNRCDGCQYHFKPLAEQEKYCRECIFYLLQED